MNWKVLAWCAFFFIPLTTMLVLDGFCSGRELCRAGLTFTLLMYGLGIAAFILALVIARLTFTALGASPGARRTTLAVLFLIPLVPGFIVLFLLAAGLMGRLG